MDDRLLNTIICGDCRDVLPTFAEGSVDTIITDPPYGLSFMGKRWDYEVPSVATWQMVLRVLKPGGTLLCFAGSRTQHRMACNVEDAGFILKDCIQYFFEPDVLAFFKCLNNDQQQAFLSLYGGPEMFWLYGSGFPKATDISKQIDKQAGAEREVVGRTNRNIAPNPHATAYAGQDKNFSESAEGREASKYITAPATAEAKLWDGWKSHGLKPAYEPILVAMKRNDGSYANNALAHGVAGLNIDAGRIATTNTYSYQKCGGNSFGVGEGIDGTREYPAESNDKGRYPANVILDEQAAAMLDEQSGEMSPSVRNHQAGDGGTGNTFMVKHPAPEQRGFRDSGGASRFFYCAKASKSERNDGCEGLAEREVVGADDRSEGKGTGYQERLGGSGKPVNGTGKQGLIRNHHPTVKPLALMEYLCRLTSTPTGGIVLDPFAGSGTTLLAAYNTGRDYIGIEKDPEYIKIIEARLAGAKAKLGLFEK